ISLCALVPLQNCSLVKTACINASSAVAAASSYPALPSRALLSVVSDKNCSGYVAATIGYTDAAQQDVVTRAILSTAVNVAGLGSISPPSSSDIAISTQLHIVVANGLSASSSTASSNSLVVDSGRVAQGVAAAMGLPSDMVSVSMTSSDSVAGSPSAAPGSPSTSSPSATHADCNGKFKFGSLCGSAAAGAVVGAALGGVLILGTIALLGAALIPSSGGRVQPVSAAAAAANVTVPTVAFITTPSPPYGPHGGSDRVTQHMGVPWTRSPVRGEPVIWEPTPWHTNYVQPPPQPSSPSPGALSTDRWSASMIPAPMRAHDRSSANTAQRRVAAYQACFPASLPSAAPASAAAAAINAHSFRHGPGAPALRQHDFYSLNVPGEGPAAGQMGGVTRVDPGGAATFDAVAQMQQGNYGAHPGAFGLVLSADHSSP
ncbi:hypothetical protein VaNZ11_002841, partial [Volvox africanus]